MTITAQHYRVFDTGLGACGVAWTASGLTRMQLPEWDRKTTGQRLRQRMGAEAWAGELPTAIAAAIAEVQDYASGAARDFRGVALCFDGLPAFHALIYHALRDVAWGRTTTYGALAKSVHAPGAARAVGVAMSRNPWPIIVPCHRVLAAQRKIGGFSAFGGATTKATLLRLEGIGWDGDKPWLPGLQV